MVANKRKDKRIKRRTRTTKKRVNVGHKKSKVNRRILPRDSSGRFTKKKKEKPKSKPKIPQKPKKISEARYIEALYRQTLLKVCGQLSEPCTVDSDVEFHIKGDEYERVNSLLYVKGTNIEALLEALSIVQRIPKKYKPWIQVALAGFPLDKFYRKDGARSFSNYATKNFAVLYAALIHNKVFENTQKYLRIDLMKVRLHWNIDDEQPEDFG